MCRKFCFEKREIILFQRLITVYENKKPYILLLLLYVYMYVCMYVYVTASLLHSFFLMLNFTPNYCHYFFFFLSLLPGEEIYTQLFSALLSAVSLSIYLSFFLFFFFFFFLSLSLSLDSSLTFKHSLSRKSEIDKTVKVVGLSISGRLRWNERRLWNGIERKRHNLCKVV